MHIITTCGTADSNYLGMFCLNGAPVKAYDVFEVNNDLSNPVVIHRTDYFDLDNEPVALMPGDTLTAGLCQGIDPTDSEVTCVSENTNLYILRFNTIDGEYHLYDFSGNDVTGDFTPSQCPGTAEKYDFVGAGKFCADGITVDRTDIIDLELVPPAPVGHYFTDAQGNIVVPTGAVEDGACNLKTEFGGQDIVTTGGESLSDYIPNFVSSFSISTGTTPISITTMSGAYTMIIPANTMYSWSDGTFDTSTITLDDTGVSLTITWTT